MSFGFGNSPRPRFLGRSENTASFKSLRNSIPTPHPDDDLNQATKVGRQEFEHLLSRTRSDRKTRKRSDRNRVKRIAARRAWGQAIKRVQRYLGLRSKVTAQSADKIDALTKVDLSKPMAQEPENSVLFVAIDVEAYEHNQDLVTEVGIATLDTTKIQSIAPGEGGQNWFSCIRAQHIRVAENSWAVNKRYVAGCADQFSFGFVFASHPNHFDGY